MALVQRGLYFYCVQKITNVGDDESIIMTSFLQQLASLDTKAGELLCPRRFESHFFRRQFVTTKAACYVHLIIKLKKG